jgi:hypothetical protein
MNGEMVFNIFVFTLFTLLWAGFIAALLFRREMLTGLWQSIRRQHLLVQLLIWLLFLPLVAGLWIWQSRWPLWLRLVLVAGLAWWNVFMFYPWPAAA